MSNELNPFRPETAQEYLVQEPFFRPVYCAQTGDMPVHTLRVDLSIGGTAPRDAIINLRYQGILGPTAGALWCNHEFSTFIIEAPVADSQFYANREGVQIGIYVDAQQVRAEQLEIRSSSKDGCILRSGGETSLVLKLSEEAIQLSPAALAIGVLEMSFEKRFEVCPV